MTTEKRADNFFGDVGLGLETLITPKAALEGMGGMDAVIRDLYGA